ncbi:scarecrow-like protein 9 [Phragmites australis]|uniref:scarecrow-like protein 9 n=1 Tax=Phragmites australis TaxID=29695 RepID=UPI002D78185B|nr:scarecrow-like protein 9 [Phragmites australis]
MVMDAGLHDLCTLLPGSRRDGHLPIYHQIAAAAHGFTPEELESLLFLPPDGTTAGGGGYLNVAPTTVVPAAYTNRASPPRDASASAGPAASAAGQAQPDDSEAFSDIVLGYINRMLMAGDIDEKFEHYPEHAALLAAEKPFLEILADQPPNSGGRAVESPDGSSIADSCYNASSCNCAVQTPASEFPTAAFLQPPQLYQDLSPESSVVEAGGAWPYDPTEFYRFQTNPVPETLLSQSSSFASSNGSGVTLSDGFESLLSSPGIMPDVGFTDFAVQSQQAMQFCRGLEEASRFLPDESKLVIDLENSASVASFQAYVKEEKKFVEITTEKADVEAAIHRGKKHLYGDDLDAEEGRCSKHSAPAIDTDHLVREMMDKVLLCNGETCSKGVKELREALQHDVAKHSNGGHGKGRGKKQPKKEVVDLETLLIHCAQSVATDDRRSATELLKQIRQHASPNGDGDQRLAHCFANGLEARLAGNGSQVYKSFTMRRFACTDVLKAYQLYLAACPFKKISHFFANQTILNAAEKAKKVHIVDFGIYYGFQWPCLIQRLSTRPDGPPRLRITGIDMPHPGYRPAERIEETGMYLKDYAQTFNVPFEFQAIASRFEAVQIEDLHIEKDELLIVNCMFKFKTLMDESVVAESPRNMVLNTIRKMNPHLFIHGIINGSYNAPFFVSRFREALFHYSAIFDMLEMNIPRDNEQRLLIESALFGREAINVMSCEGLERMERPETYKQWQVRNQRAGFKQLPMNQDIMKLAREKVRCYHKDFIIDEDNRWLLQGWKGRILLALSTWKPDHRSSS